MSIRHQVTAQHQNNKSDINNLPPSPSRDKLFSEVRDRYAELYSRLTFVDTWCIGKEGDIGISEFDQGVRVVMELQAIQREVIYLAGMFTDAINNIQN